MVLGNGVWINNELWYWDVSKGALCTLNLKSKRISVKYVENEEYYIALNKLLTQQGLETFDVFASGIQYAADMNGITMEQIFEVNGVSSMEELYQLGVEQAEATLYQQGIRPYLEEEMVVSAVYSNKELVGQAGMNTLIGMGTVFIVLIFISFIISFVESSFLFSSCV